MLRPTRFAAMLLALLLADSQFALAAHDIEHAVAGPDHACAQCLHQPVHKNLLPGSHAAAAGIAPAAAEFDAAAPLRSGALAHPYRSRAPPDSRR